MIADSQSPLIGDLKDTPVRPALLSGPGGAWRAPSEGCAEDSALYSTVSVSLSIPERVSANS
jgi:hypothetical protein